MRIVVVGDGKVGSLLTKLLAREGHDVVVIDRNEEILRDVQEKLDVAIVTGNGASVQIQREAGVADVRIAPVGPVIGAHVGAGMTALVYWEKDRA